MKLVIATPLREEHDELQEELARAVKVDGRIGEAAREVALLLEPRFVEEKQDALPPLGLLQALVEGPVTADTQDVLLLDRLKADLPKMLAGHGAVVGALRKLAATAEREEKPEWARFAEKLILHIQFEERVLYPAAILVGEHVKARA